MDSLWTRSVPAVHWGHHQESSTLRMGTKQGSAVMLDPKQQAQARFGKGGCCFPNTALANRKPVAFCVL